MYKFVCMMMVIMGIILVIGCNNDSNNNGDNDGNNVKPSPTSTYTSPTPTVSVIPTPEYIELTDREKQQLVGNAMADYSSAVNSSDVIVSGEVQNDDYLLLTGQIKDGNASVLLAVDRKDGSVDGSLITTYTYFNDMKYLELDGKQYVVIVGGTSDNYSERKYDEKRGSNNPHFRANIYPCEFHVEVPKLLEGKGVLGYDAHSNERPSSDDPLQRHANISVIADEYITHINRFDSSDGRLYCDQFAPAVSATGKVSVDLERCITRLAPGQPFAE